MTQIKFYIYLDNTV